MEMIARGDGWLEADRGAFEFALRLPKTPGEPIEGDLGAGRVFAFRKLVPRDTTPPDIAGTYFCADAGATWRIDGKQIEVSGPYVASIAPVAAARRRGRRGRDRDVLRLGHHHPARAPRSRRIGQAGPHRLDQPHQEHQVREGVMILPLPASGERVGVRFVRQTATAVR